MLCWALSRLHASLGISLCARCDTGADWIWQVRFWDIASGKQVRQVAASEFAFVAGAEMREHTTNRHLLKAYGDTLLITKLVPDGGAEHIGAIGADRPFHGPVAAPVASFKAPQSIHSVQCHGATICVGCVGGAVCILSAPFLAA